MMFGFVRRMLLGVGVEEPPAEAAPARPAGGAGPARPGRGRRRRGGAGPEAGNDERRRRNGGEIRQMLVHGASSLKGESPGGTAPSNAAVAPPLFSGDTVKSGPQNAGGHG